MNDRSKPMVLRLMLEPDPCSELEEIEDLVASTLWRHGWRGGVKSDATGNTVTLKFLPQVDDGRAYPRQGRLDVTVGELAHAFQRVLAYLAIHDSQYHNTNADALKARALLDRLDGPDALDEVLDDGDDQEDGWDDDQPDDLIFDRSDDWPGYANADSVEI